MPVPKLHRIHPEMQKHAADLRRPLTPAEQIVWSQVRNRALGGFKIRRQVPLGNYIVDFYCHEARLVIEVDGDSHAEQGKYDCKRTAWLETQGLTVIRFSNREVHQTPDEVLLAILSACQNGATKAH